MKFTKNQVANFLWRKLVGTKEDGFYEWTLFYVEQLLRAWEQILWLLLDIIFNGKYERLHIIFRSKYPLYSKFLHLFPHSGISLQVYFFFFLIYVDIIIIIV